MTLLLTTSCVVPIPASFEGGDAAPERNTPPVIVKSVPEEMPGPITLREDVAQEYTLTLRDDDIDDTLYVRVFRDYQKGPLGPLDQPIVPNDPVNGTVLRSVTIKTGNWCNQVLPGTQVYIEVVVADRPFDEDGTRKPEYQVTTGNLTKGWWVATCAQPL